MTVKTVKCPKCKNELTITGKPGEKTHIICPKCNSKGIFTFPIEKTELKTTTDSLTIEVRNLTKKYNNFKAVDDVSFNVKSGEIFGFLGPNGAGKTTTIKSMLGLIHVNSGEIKINEFDIKKMGKDAKKYVGYLPEKVAFYDNLTALQNMYFYAEMKNIPKEECKPLIEEMGIGDAVNKKVGKFSKGMQQRLGMARALLGNPPILILDEPSGGLDPRGVALIRNKIREMKDKGSTVFVSSHILAEVQEVCDRVGIIDKGVLVAEDSVSKLSVKLNLKPKIIIELEKMSEKIVESVKKVEGVEKVEAIGVMIHITCNQKAKSKIIISVEKAGGDIVNIQTKEPSLEEVFMRFTEG
jgi:ABC-type multidrug transport system ATPase subunit/DNA-directed RNA polymerase subunit RPC12/RpoP